MPAKLTVRLTWVVLSEVLPPAIKGPAASLATAAAWTGERPGLAAVCLGMQFGRHTELSLCGLQWSCIKASSIVTSCHWCVALGLQPDRHTTPVTTNAVPSVLPLAGAAAGPLAAPMLEYTKK
jgi:hypothetical protein